ncbi:bile acid:sodium symporter [Parasphingopyxis lamellibrachiae]|uniref:Sodium/bile acid cotransporter 7 n=1 Tax=Parasphingopyxis lamellibrachiae TaxID=680125 RepID=A0A3D9FEG4_9SPHN|nr:bile acid:sodium symporter [Parasphingopyxis lamellibrachiae]RED16210.1 sodium/bile acid cotransporter 7 [Parasphingopyxis lamellibrachiae]
MQRLASILVPDRFIIILLAMVGVAALLPARGMALDLLGTVSTICIVLLFFVHGARLSRQAVLGGFTRLKLHLAIVGFTFLTFPLLGLALTTLAAPFIDPAFVPGILFLCALPTTVASSIAMVSMARGNIAASVIAAALSSMLGVVLTPLMFAALLSTSGAPIDISGIGKVVLILALPFAVGQLCRPAVGAWVEAHPGVSRTLDRLTILLAIYVALSAAVGGGLLDGLGLGRFLLLLALMLVLLALVIGTAMLAARVLGFNFGDGTALLFAAMQKSVISGTPMARILFPGAEAGLIIVPLLVYYVPMMTVSAIMAARMGARHAPG